MYLQQINSLINVLPYYKFRETTSTDECFLCATGKDQWINVMPRTKLH